MQNQTCDVVEERYANRRSEQELAKAKAFREQSPTSVPEPRSAVEEALASLLSETSECHAQADMLIGSISTAMSADSEVCSDRPARPIMASELAERIQYAADSIRALRDKLVHTRYRVTL